MKLKRTLLWARLRSLRTYVKVVLRHFNVHFPYNQPEILGGTPDYLTAVIVYDADLSKAQKNFFIDRIRSNWITKKMPLKFVKKTNRVRGHPIWQVSMCHSGLYTYAVVTYYPSEELEEEAFLRFPLIDEANI